MSLIPIEGRDGYFRDTHSNAIINKNASDYNSYMASHKKLTTDKERINSLESEIDSIRGDLGDIKMMLQHFMDKHK